MHTERNDDITMQSAPSQAEEGGTESAQPLIEEIGGMNGPDPTRYGDWEKNGRCIDF